MVGRGAGVIFCLFLLPIPLWMKRPGFFYTNSLCTCCKAQKGSLDLWIKCVPEKKKIVFFSNWPFKFHEPCSGIGGQSSLCLEIRFPQKQRNQRTFNLSVFFLRDEELCSWPPHSHDRRDTKTNWCDCCTGTSCLIPKTNAKKFVWIKQLSNWAGR